MDDCNLSGNKSPMFSRDMSNLVKGVAILLMIAHHCFSFPEYWVDEFSISPFLADVCNQFKICVAVFAFITGYGFYVSKRASYLHMFRKMLQFLCRYWLQLFLIFLPVAAIHFDFSAKQILNNMIALYDNVILFGWYVFFHCVVLLTFPLVKKTLNRTPVWDLAIVLAGGYCVTVILYFLPFETPLFSMLLDCSIYYPVVGIGYLSAKYAVFDRISEKITFRIPMALLMLAMIFFLRSKIDVIKGFAVDTIYAPTFVLAMIWLLKDCRLLHSGLGFLGKHSFHMWLFHAIFFSVYTRDVAQPLVGWTDVPFLRFLLVLLLSTAVAFLIDTFWTYLMKLVYRKNKESVLCT